MTREEIINKLKELRDAKYSTDEILLPLSTREILNEVIRIISIPEPQGLDEAAEEYGENNWFDVEDEHGRHNIAAPKIAKESFKAGAKWRDEQIPKLPDSVDEAAEEYADGHSSDEAVMEMAAFKAGAEWMAEQGIIVNGEIVGGDNCLDCEIDDYLPKDTPFNNGDKVIVQIRKKENEKEKCYGKFRLE